MDSCETFRTKWLQFERENAPRRKTEIWHVYNHSGEYLGCIKWYSQWRQYCYIVEHDDSQQRPLKLVMAKSCLEDITAFITGLMESRANGQKLGPDGTVRIMAPSGWD